MQAFKLLFCCYFFTLCRSQLRPPRDRYPDWQLHHLMSGEDLLSIFNVDLPEAVPWYDLVHLSPGYFSTNYDNLTTTVLHINAFKSPRILHLTENKFISANAPVYVDGSHVPMETDAIGFQDPENRAAVVISTEEDGTFLPVVNGVVDELTVLRLPDTDFFHNLFPLSDEELRRRGFFDHFIEDLRKLQKMMYDQENRGAVHVVWKTEFPDYSVRIYDDPTHERKSSRRNIAKKIYPEIVVIVDAPVLKMFGNRTDEMLKYVVGFWNAVDLRFKNFLNPSIELSLKAVFLQTETLNSHSQIPSPPQHDLKILMTNLPCLYYERVVTEEDNECDPLGVSPLYGACVHELSNWNPIGTVKDFGMFSGVPAAAHVVINMLGAGGGGYTVDSVAGFPASFCGRDSPLLINTTDIGFNWPKCLIADIRDFLTDSESSCLVNYPNWPVCSPDGQPVHHTEFIQAVTIDDEDYDTNHDDYDDYEEHQQEQDYDDSYDDYEVHGEHEEQEQIRDHQPEEEQEREHTEHKFYIIN